MRSHIVLARSGMKFGRMLLLVAAASAAFGQGNHGNVAPDISLSNPNAMVDVIVQFKNAPTKNDLKKLGPYGQMKKIFNGIKAAQVTLSVSTIQSLASDPDIAYISPNRPTKGSLDTTTATVGANLVWSYGYSGAGVGVAVIDSGITVTSDLGSRV